jgi:guanylate kinase
MSSGDDPLKPVVFCGPSGVGKGTLIDLLFKRFPNDQFGFSVSHTTRSPRPGEEDGVHYHFTTVEQIKKDIDAGKFIEYAEVHGKYYGTRYVRFVLAHVFGTKRQTEHLLCLIRLIGFNSIAAVESVQANGRICVLDIDVQGVQKVKQSHLKPHYVFIAPPSKEDLEKRLRGRNTETEEAIQTRLANAAKELEYGQTTGNFDRIFINADLKSCFETMVEQFKEWYPHLVEMAPDDEQKNCTSCSVS